MYCTHIDSDLCLCYYYLDAAVAQVVAHLIGSEEVTGPSPVSSLTKTLEKSRVLFICVIFNARSLCISVDSSNAYFTAYYSFYFSVRIHKQGSGLVNSKCRG